MRTGAVQTMMTSMILMLASRVAAQADKAGDLLDINGHMAGPSLHNRFIIAGLIIYTTTITGAILYLGKRKTAGVLVAVAGLGVGLILANAIIG
jgi:hypothetical protein